MRYFTWKLELVSNILWMIVIIFLASFSRPIESNLKQKKCHNSTIAEQLWIKNKSVWLLGKLLLPAGFSNLTLFVTKPPAISLNFEILWKLYYHKTICNHFKFWNFMENVLSQNQLQSIWILKFFGKRKLNVVCNTVFLPKLEAVNHFQSLPYFFLENFWYYPFQKDPEWNLPGRENY